MVLINNTFKKAATYVISYRAPSKHGGYCSKKSKLFIIFTAHVVLASNLDGLRIYIYSKNATFGEKDAIRLQVTVVAQQL